MIKNIAVCDVCSIEKELLNNQVRGRKLIPMGWHQITDEQHFPSSVPLYNTTYLYLFCSLTCIVTHYRDQLAKERQRASKD